MSPFEPPLYFAYGSNLLSQRMSERVPSARPAGTAWLDDHLLSFGKRGRDGSGKATLVVEPGSRVWGALYCIDPEHWERLDGFEPGYARVAKDVVSERHGRLSATTYIAPETANEPIAFAWYKRLIVDGAREHGLPAAYVSELERLPARSAPA